MSNSGKPYSLRVGNPEPSLSKKLLRKVQRLDGIRLMMKINGEGIVQRTKLIIGGSESCSVMKRVVAGSNPARTATYFTVTQSALAYTEGAF